MAIDKKDFIIAILCVLLFGCVFIISGQHAHINILESEVRSNREVINAELRLIDSIYDNNYRLWDGRIDHLLKYYESQGYLIQK